MITKYFKCTLLTDVVLNASLATEGNMQSLDFIPGSNFLGIVAKNYKEFGNDAFDIFHCGKVLFGDALISKNEKISYALPFSLFQDKLENKITVNQVWVHHKLAELEKDQLPKNRNGDQRQLKQNRKGYFNNDNKYIEKVEKNFSLKSAYNAKERRSDDGKMFGFDAIKSGQIYIFSVKFDDDKYIETVTNALKGKKQLGKSKTAQYGQVFIEHLQNEKVPIPFSNCKTENNQLIIYAESRLIFLNEFGNPTFQPKPCYFGIAGNNLDFAWNKCQIRTGSYSPWNAKRNTPDSQRSFIERGSVFVLETDESIYVDNLPKIVGVHQNEGFGRVIYNPEFLKYEDNGIWIFDISEYPKDNMMPDNTPVNSTLGKFLQAKSKEERNELSIGEKIIKLFDSKDGKTLLDDRITKSQWGSIRTLATQAKSYEDLKNSLFDEKIGYLTHGVADEKIWGKNKGMRRKALSRIIEENRDLGTQFVAKFAAEIAKKQDQNG